MNCKGLKAILGGTDKCYSATETKAEENKRTFYLDVRNDKISFCRIKYDKCIYQGKDEHCDYIFALNHSDKKTEWLFIELKGQDIKKGIDQITASIKQIGQSKLKGRLSAFVVSSKVPKAARSDVKNAKERFAKTFKTIPIVKNNTYTHIVR